MPANLKILQWGILVILIFLATGCQPIVEGQALPEGAEIAFVSWRDQNVEIYKMTPAGAVNLTQTTANEAFPVWSPDGSQLAFLVDESNQQHLALMDADGSNRHLLAESVLALDEAPVWAPDGQMIAFACVAEQRSSLCLVSVSGGWMQIMPGEWASLGGIQWSPTDPIILFHAMSGNSRDIFAYTTYTNRTRNLTNRSGQDHSPAWSPDGRRIAMISDLNDHPGLYIMKIDGTYPRLLLEDTLQNSLEWSPDGQFIAFSQAAVGETHLCVLQVNSQVLHCTVKNGEHPVWSPNSQNLVYESRSNNRSNLYLTDPNCNRPRRLTADSAGSFTPHWRP
jgi:TolB protein